MNFSPYIRLDTSNAAIAPRWNFAGGQALAMLRCDSATGTSSLTGNYFPSRQWTDPLSALAWIAESATHLPANTRWVGYLSYDLGRLFERIPTSATDDLSLPLFAFALVNDRGNHGHHIEHLIDKKPLQSNFSRDEYETAVRRAIAYIAAGDIFQVNLSQRFSAGLRCQPMEVYQRLCARSPAVFGGFLDFGDHALVCNSPELFFRVVRSRDGSPRILTRPIKGTRPRGEGMEEALRESQKDQAELNMIVDLERNDLGRICKVGSVQVVNAREIEEHPTVYHGVATIEGVLRDNISFVEMLRAIFPGGSITGAPKIRVMEIIEELEPTRRGPYCGAIGYLAADGEMQFNMAIRTIIIKDGVAYASVGGGVVADSKPAAEYDETLVKARAMFDALGIALPR